MVNRGIILTNYLKNINLVFFFSSFFSASACPACVVPEIVFKIVFWLGYCNSFVNPLIYALSNHTFRRAFRKYTHVIYFLVNIYKLSLKTPDRIDV